jgi:hypothetical protein
MTEVIAALAGVIVGAVASELTEHLRIRRSKKALAAALNAEVSALHDRYMEIIGTEIENLGDAHYIQGSLTIGEGYFTVFESGASLLGLLDPKDAHRIVSFYMRARGHLDSLRTYKELYENPNVLIPEKVRYSSQIKQDHMELKRQLNDLRDVLSRC